MRPHKLPAFCLPLYACLPPACPSAFLDDHIGVYGCGALLLEGGASKTAKTRDNQSLQGKVSG